MSKFLMTIFAASFFMLFGGSASAEGLFTKVDSYTLEGMGGVRPQNSSVLSVYQVNVPGFHSLVDCQAALQALKDRDYPAATGTSMTQVSALTSKQHEKRRCGYGHKNFHFFTLLIG